MFFCIIYFSLLKLPPPPRAAILVYTSILMCVKSHLDMNIDMYIVYVCSLSLSQNMGVLAFSRVGSTSDLHVGSIQIEPNA